MFFVHAKPVLPACPCLFCLPPSSELSLFIKSVYSPPMLSSLLHSGVLRHTTPDIITGQTTMFLDCGRKPEYLERTMHREKMQNTYRTTEEPGSEPRTFLVPENCAINHALPFIHLFLNHFPVHEWVLSRFHQQSKKLILSL
ncbi:hypothetical protein AMECASPLE_010892 [Ameca splendens]|uniref:Uncharacterized protein n=1 Tax=Ameca splendens TaxID=208324 RepID=A0ABV0XDS6_9TELE